MAFMDTLTTVLGSATYHTLFYWTGVLIVLGVAVGHVAVYAGVRKLAQVWRRPLSPRLLHFMQQYLVWLLATAWMMLVLMSVAYERVSPGFGAVQIAVIMAALLWVSVALHARAHRQDVITGADPLHGSGKSPLLEESEVESREHDHADWRVRLRRRWSNLVRLAASYHVGVDAIVQQNKALFVAVAVVMMGLTVFSVVATRDVCIAFEPMEISTAMTRASMPPTCAGPSPCQVYLTVPEDMRTGMIVNFHIADDREIRANQRVGWVVFDTQPRNRVADYAFAIHAVGVTDHDWVLKYEVPRSVWYAPLQGLSSNTTYFFRAGIGGEILSSLEDQYFTAEDHFLTAPSNATTGFSFVSGGDIGVYPKANAMHRVAAAQDPLLAVVGGDLAYANAFRACYRRWDVFLQNWYREMRGSSGRLIPMMLGIGNHEVGGIEQTADVNPFYLAYLPQHSGASPRPSQRPSYHEHVIANNLAVYALDTWHISGIEGDQAAWLDAMLASQISAGVTFNLVTYHVPIYPSIWSQYAEQFSEAGHSAWVPVFDKHHVQVAFENHGHWWKRSHPLKENKVVADGQGTVYMGDGAWGTMTPHRSVPAEDAWYLAASKGSNNIMRVDVAATQLTITSLDVEGSVLDVVVVPA